MKERISTHDDIILVSKLVKFIPVHFDRSDAFDIIFG